MATLTVPPVPPSPRDDAMQLYRAFKGTLSLSLFKIVGDVYMHACNPVLWALIW